MEIKITKYTNYSAMKKAMEYTSDKEINFTEKTANQMYNSQHSPIRTQRYLIELIEIPTFVSVHLVRHHVGIDHYVKSNREDRANVNDTANRNTPVNHLMDLNAEALINIARKRLCFKASKETREVMEQIVLELSKQNDALANYLQPECWYRGGECHEQKSCFVCNGYNYNLYYIDLIKRKQESEK